MFKNIRYIDPKLFQEDGQPRYNFKLTPTDWKSFTTFTDSTETCTKFYDIFLQKGLVAYDNAIDSYEVFTNSIEYYRNIPFDENQYKIVNSINGTSSPVSGRSDCFTSIFRGYILIEEDGDYSFSCRGDDCHAFCIDNQTFLFDSGTSNVDGTKTLTKGLHKVEFYQREWTGGESYALYWKRPGESSFTVVENVFYHTPDRSFIDLSDDVGVIAGDTVFEILYNDDNELIKDDSNIKIDKVYGVKFDGYKSHSDSSNGSDAIPDAHDFSLEQESGKVVFTNSESEVTRFYKFLLEGGVTYTFSRTASYDDQVWIYDENGSYTGENYDGTGNFTKRFDKDTVGYIEVGTYNRDIYYYGTGTTTLTISPTPLPVLSPRFIKDERCIFSDDENFLLGQNNVSYSLWYYKGETASGPVMSMTKDGVTKFSLYIENGLLYFYNGVNSVNIATMSDSYFNKKGVNSPVHICFTYDFQNSFASVFLDGLYVYGGVEHIDVVCDKFILGGSTIYGKNNTLDGSVKWLRTYDRVLSQIEISNLAREFDNCPGDGASWTRAMGSIPDTIEEDTAYVIRRYEDGTSTYIGTNTYNVSKIGFFSAPYSVSSINNLLPKTVSSCPWIGEKGSARLEQLVANSMVSSSKLSYFVMDDIIVLKAKDSSSYMFKISTSSADSVFLFNNCRFSSDGCTIDTNNSYNESAGRYFMFTGTVGEFVMKNCTIVNTNISYDAFKIFSCKNAIIRNVDIYTSPASRNYNAFCFGFMHGNSSYDYSYDNFYNYTSNTSLEDIDINNVRMIVRCNTNSQVPGLIISTGVNRVKMKNISIQEGAGLTPTTSKIGFYNGLINMRWMWDYRVNNININLPSSNKVYYHPIVCLCVTELGDTVSISQGKSQYHLIENVNITIGSSSSDVNSSSERNYFTTGTVDYERFTPYTVFCVYSDNDPMQGIHLVRDCFVSAGRCASIAMKSVFGTFNSVNGVIRVNDSRVDIENFNTVYNSGIIDIHHNAEVNIDNLTVSNPIGENLISYRTESNGYETSHVFIKNSNCQIQKLGFDKSGGGENSAFVYCPNTEVNGGFSMNGMSHFIIPVDVHRNNGHGVSLRLAKNGSQTNAFRFPPKPYDGIGYNLTTGNRRMTIHFSEAESNISSDITYEDLLQNLWIEVETSDGVYSSKIDGEWLEDDEMWNYEALKPFKYVLDFTLNQSEKVFVRVYYNMDTHANGGLFLDPKIDWE